VATSNENTRWWETSDNATETNTGGGRGDGEADGVIEMEEDVDVVMEGDKPDVGETVAVPVRVIDGVVEKVGDGDKDGCGVTVDDLEAVRVRDAVWVAVGDTVGVLDLLSDDDNERDGDKVKVADTEPDSVPDIDSDDVADAKLENDVDAEGDTEILGE
jgi:hypothetical protein